MKSGQFFKGMINGVEDTYETLDLLQVLPSEKLAVLWDLERIGEYKRVFLNERVITKTVVARAVPDMHGREGITNHTVLYRFPLRTVVDGAPYIFDEDQFVNDVQAGNYNFSMPSAPELKRPLDLPPQFEAVKQ